MRTVPGTHPVKLKGLKLQFLSAVKHPAHEGAEAVLLKARGAKAPMTDEEKQRDKMRAERKRRKKAPTSTAYAAKEWGGILGKAYRAAGYEEPRDFFDALADGEVDLAKYGDEDDSIALMTSSDAGHAHLLYVRGRAGTTSYGKSTGSESGHDHPWMITFSEDGTIRIRIGESEGHAHEIDEPAVNAAFAAAAFSKSEKEGTVQKPDPKTQKTDEVKQLEDRLALATLYAGLNDAERQHLDGLDEVGKTAFVQKDAAGRQAEIEAKKAASPVIYKGRDGTAYTAASDPSVIALAKRVDQAEERAEKSEKVMEQERLEKRALSELPNLPGEPAVKAALLKALDAIPDAAMRESALKGLKAGDAGVALAFKALGTSEGERELGIDSQHAGSPAKAEFDELVEKAATEHKLNKAKATQEVLKTDRGRALYKTIHEARRATTTGQPVQ